MVVNPVHTEIYEKKASGTRGAHIAQGAAASWVQVPENPNTTEPVEVGSTIHLSHYTTDMNRNNQTKNAKVPRTNQLRSDGVFENASAAAKTSYNKLQSGNVQSGGAGNFSGPTKLPPGIPPAPVDPAPPGLIADIYKAFGETLGDPPEHSVRLVGVRNAQTVANSNSFSDVMHIFVKTATDWSVHSAAITTTPGAQVLGKYMGTAKGTGVVASPQIGIGKYIIRKHNNRYLALGQNKGLYIWRDKNANGIADDGPGPDLNLIYDAIGANIHRANPKGTTTKISGNYRKGSQKKDGKLKGSNYYYTDANGKVHKEFQQSYSYSTACQVYATADDFHKMLEWCKRDRDTNGVKSFDYVLLDSGDYENIKNGKDISSYLKTTMDYYKNNAVRNTSS